MQTSAELYKSILENLIKDAAADGYDLYVEVLGSVEVDRYEERFDLDEVTLTFSNQEKAKRSQAAIDYASADTSIYYSGMA